MAVDDSKFNIGSGSAALNALICVAENLAAIEGHKVVSSEVLYNAKILILLLGATFPFSPCGHAFMPHSSSSAELGFEQTEVPLNFDLLLDTLNKLSDKSPPGVWISSTDMVLEATGCVNPVNLSGCDGITAFTLLATPEHAMNHGTCTVSETGEITRIEYMPGKENIGAFKTPDGGCLMLSGVVYFTPRVAETMLSLHNLPPLDACTYVGLDNGAKPLSLSLFFDILQCLTTSTTQEDYIAGKYRSSTQQSSETPPAIMERARSLLWKHLRGTKLRSVFLQGMTHRYFQHVAYDVVQRYVQCAPQGKVVVNSLLGEEVKVGPGSLVLNCDVKVPVTIGKNCFLSGLSSSVLGLDALVTPPTIPDGLVVQGLDVVFGNGGKNTKQSILVFYGLHDNLLDDYSSSSATFCNAPWSEFFQRTGVQPSELWSPSTPPGAQTLLNAQLFVAASPHEEYTLPDALWMSGATAPNGDLSRWRSSWRLSLATILQYVNSEAELNKMRNISFELQLEKMKRVLKNNEPTCILRFFKDSLIEHREHDILQTLDEVAEQMDNTLIICRIYACIADMLGFMAGEGGGIRAGPAANLSWQTAFQLLERGNYAAATRALAVERGNWITGGQDHIIRASRHYERAGQILTRNVVATASRYIVGTPCDVPALGQRVIVTAPARVDISGGWTDTPPQSYEWGGMVVTLALTVEGQCPIKSVAQRIPELKLVLITGEGSDAQAVECTTLSHLSDYSQPHAPAALLKAAFICAKIVEFPSSASLAEQLSSRYGCGFMLQAVSNLPQGSGLGTSSILGGAILGALWRAVGQLHSEDSLIHAVLYLEQLLTTGGGWQDQCGGLYGGIKISQSSKGLPVLVTTKKLSTPPGFLDKLSDHLLLVYTGKTRLARNLLQDVLRNWHSRDHRIVQNMTDLVNTAMEAAQAVEQGDLARMGRCMTSYQQQKLCMAPGSMPKVVGIFVDTVRDLIHGCCFAGAGGGGFLLAIMKDPKDKPHIKKTVEATTELSDFVLYDSAIDKMGIQYSID